MRISDNGPTPSQWFLLELQRMEGCPHTKMRVRDLLRRLAGQRLYLSREVVEAPLRAEAAMVLLDSGMHRGQVTAHIQHRFGVTHRTATRTVVAAIHERCARSAGCAK